MKKILILFVMIAVITTILCGCVEGDYQEPRENTEYQMWLNSGSIFVYSFKDEETGVWCVATNHGVTPRLDSNGNPYVEKVK